MIEEVTPEKYRRYLNLLFRNSPRQKVINMAVIECDDGDIIGALIGTDDQSEEIDGYG